MPDKSKTVPRIKPKVDHEKLLAEARAKARLMEKLDYKILLMNDKIDAKKIQLNKEKEDNVSNRVKNMRIKTRKMQYLVDTSLRPSDRGNDIRLYTKMDLDVWAYPQVREWFNSAADPNANPVFDDSYRITPSQSGYMLKIGENYTERRHTQPPPSNLESVSQSGAPSPRP